MTQTPEKKQEDFVFLMNVPDGNILSMVCALLEDEGILYWLKDRESGSYMRIMFGLSIYGADIYVDRESIERAKDAVKVFSPTEEKEDEEI